MFCYQCEQTAKGTFFEKRKHKRFNAQAVTFVVLKHHSCRLGTIQDISRNGLSFQYIEADGNVLHGSTVIEDLFQGNDHHPLKMPVRIVSDVKVGAPPFSFIPMRRCGLQFLEMTSSIISQVEEFIGKYAL